MILLLLLGIPTEPKKNIIQTTQNKCIRSCLQLDKMAHISYKEFETLNWLRLTERSSQRIISVVFYCNDCCPNNLNEVFKTVLQNNFQTTGSFQKLKYIYCKTNMGQNALSYIGPIIGHKTADSFRQTNSTRPNTKKTLFFVALFLVFIYF